MMISTNSWRYRTNHAGFRKLEIFYILLGFNSLIGLGLEGFALVMLP